MDQTILSPFNPFTTDHPETVGVTTWPKQAEDGTPYCLCQFYYLDKQKLKTLMREFTYTNDGIIFGEDTSYYSNRNICCKNYWENGEITRAQYFTSDGKPWREVRPAA